MGFLRRLVCVVSVLACALVFPSQAVAKHHAAPEKKQVQVKKTSADRSTRSKAKSRDTSSASSKNERKSARQTVSVERKGKSRSSKSRKLDHEPKASKHAKASRVNFAKQPARPSVQDSDELSLDRSGNPLLRSSAFLVQDVRSGNVLLERNARTVVPIASITKLMTAMVVLDARLPLNETLTISEANVDRLKGTSSHLSVGTQMTRENLLRLALMSSENRAASALAHNYPGGLPVFVDAMNAKARSLGMSDTRYFDSSGLNRNNVSSARDLAILVSSAAHYPLIREFTTTSEYTVDLLGGRPHTFHNTNGLVKSPAWQIEVSKTGFINESGKCLVMQAWLANRPLAIVLLDSWGRYTRQADANRIRRWLEDVLPRNGAAAKVADLRVAASRLN